MPLRVMNSTTSQKSPLTSSGSLPPSRSNSASSSSTAAQQPEGWPESLRSNSSSEEYTLHTQRSHPDIKEEENLPGYSDDGNMYTRFFEKEKQRISQEFDPYNPATLPHGPHSASSSSSRLHSSRTARHLADALGPENSSHSTEIDTIPCAGIRIRHGPLSGLLAWRLIVRVPDEHGLNWWKGSVKPTKKFRRSSIVPSALLPPPPSRPVHSHSYSEWTVPKGYEMAETNLNLPASLSSNSLPLPQFPTLPRTKSCDTAPNAPPQRPSALVANFILDTSLPYSLISRDTLLALGYPSSHLPPPSDPNDLSNGSNDAPSITLSIQGVNTCLRFANPGEPSCLGVQFLQDAGVSVFFPRDGDGVGPVLYLESARGMEDVPTTLPHAPRGYRLSLQQRVRILFGLSS